MGKLKFSRELTDEENVSFRIFLYTMAFLGLIGFTARAGFYTYRDEEGTLHAVSSDTEIPERYRKKQKFLGKLGESVSASGFDLMRDGQNLYVNATIGGTACLFQLASTAAASTITPALMLKLKLPTIGSMAIKTSTGEVQAPAVDAPQVTIGDFSVPSLRMAVFAGAEQSKADGVLGADFLGHFQSQVDAENAKLRLDKK